MKINTFMKYALTLLFFFCPVLWAGNFETKTINFKNGTAVFDVPMEWKEKYKESDGMIVYKNVPEQDSLSVSFVMVSVTKKNSQEVMDNMFPIERYQVLPKGYRVQFKTSEISVKGESFSQFTWTVAVPVPNQVRFLMFTYTVPYTLKDDAETQKMIKYFDGSIKQASFAQDSIQSGK